MSMIVDWYDEVQLQLECVVDDPEAQFIERQEFESRYYREMARAQVLDSGSTSSLMTEKLCQQLNLQTSQLEEVSAKSPNYSPEEHMCEEHFIENTSRLEDGRFCESFPEYNLLLNKQSLPKKSQLIKFNIYIDENNIMRVGGRIDNSDFPIDKKHPILISDPTDLSPLTPGHFLIGRPLTSLPQDDYRIKSFDHLTRFQRIEQLRQHFWARWSKEYIAELQQRTKWRTNQDNLKLDTLVVVKDDNLPPLKWRLGRVVAIHPGLDGFARVADIRPAAGVIRRAFSKICPLPVFSTTG
ncbi:uncharacterized protein LOC106143603 [Amyelois transitella]|uniref:uncharacterized protein LOC106143603 n=1 Tax=Amyelois transitella TaxID=680683 RepID=UPI00298F9729|nr:uncharacterized protein LOC106143603 [Amyelois transitella]